MKDINANESQSIPQLMAPRAKASSEISIKYAAYLLKEGSLLTRARKPSMCEGKRTSKQAMCFDLVR